MRYRIVRHYQIENVHGSIVERQSKIIRTNMSAKRAIEFLAGCHDGLRLDPRSGKTYRYKTIMQQVFRKKDSDNHDADN